MIDAVVLKAVKPENRVTSGHNQQIFEFNCEELLTGPPFTEADEEKDQ